MIDIVNLSKLLGNAEKVQNALAEINRRVERGESFEKVLQSIINELSKNKEEPVNMDLVASKKSLQSSNNLQSKVNANDIFDGQESEKVEDSEKSEKVIQGFNKTPTNLKGGEEVLSAEDDSNNTDELKVLYFEDETLERVEDYSKQIEESQNSDSKVIEKEREFTDSKVFEMAKTEESVPDTISNQSSQLEEQEHRDEDVNGTKEQTEIRKEFMEKFKPENLPEQKNGKIYANAERYFERDYTNPEHLNKTGANISSKEQLGDYLKEEIYTNRGNINTTVDTQLVNNQTQNVQLKATANQEARSTTQGDTPKQVNTQVSNTKIQNVLSETTISQNARPTTQGQITKQVNTQVSSDETQNTQLKTAANQEARPTIQGNTTKQINTQVSNTKIQNVLPETTISQNARPTTHGQITKQINTQVSNNQTKNVQLKATANQETRPEIQGNTTKQINTQVSNTKIQNVLSETTISQSARPTTQGQITKQINTQVSNNQTQNVQLKTTANQEARPTIQGNTTKQINTQVSNTKIQNVLSETTISQNARPTTQGQITKQINTQVSNNQMQNIQNTQLKVPVYQDMRLTSQNTTNVTPNKNSEVLGRDNLLKNNVQKDKLTENTQASKLDFAVENNHTVTKKNDTSRLVKSELTKTEDSQLIERADKSNNDKTEKFDKLTSYHTNIQTNQKEHNPSNGYTISSQNVAQNVVKNAEKSEKIIYQKASEHNDIISKELLNNNNAYVLNRSSDSLEKLSGIRVVPYEIIETNSNTTRKIIYKQEDMDKSKTEVFIGDKEFLEIVQKINLMISPNINTITSNSITTRSLQPVHVIINDAINQSAVNELKEPDSVKMLLTSLKDVANEQSGLTIRNWKKDESMELKEMSRQNIFTKDKESVNKTELTVKNQDNPSNLTSQAMSPVEVHNRFVSQVVEDVKTFDAQDIESSSKEQVQSQNVPSATDTQRTNDNSTQTKNHMEEFRNSPEQPSKNKIEIKSFEVEYKTKEETEERKLEHSNERPNISNKFIERLAEMTYKPSEAKLEQTYQSVNRFELAERLQHAQNLEEIYQRIREFGFSNRLEENVRMRLYPENLGNLDVELKKEGRFISVVFVAENEKSRELLEKNASYLRDRLSNLDFEVRAVEVRMKEENNNYEDGRQQRHGQEPNEQNNQEHRRKAFKEEVMKDDDERKRNV